jgi:hypothetical protein
MADYYPLITKAVAGLDPDAPRESRRAIYERARAALLAQLRIINPPFTEAEITHERLALEEAVRIVEGEAAERARNARVPAFHNRVPAFGDLPTDADDPGMASPSSLNEISVEVPSMIVTCAARGRLTPIWRCTWR